MRLLKITGLAATTTLALTSWASAASIDYVAYLTDINNFGASGEVRLTLDTDANTLAVNVQADGLDPDVTHVQHIHGVTGGNSVTPTAAQDTDGDGFIELLEGAATYGPIVLSLTDDTVDGLGGFPTAPGGSIDFSFTYDLLTTSAYNGDADINDLLSLEDREIVIHGAFTNFLPEDIIPGLGGGILDDGFGNPLSAGGPVYNAALPVLAGEIERLTPVPLPAAGWLFLAGLGAFGAVKRRKG